MARFQIYRKAFAALLAGALALLATWLPGVAAAIPAPVLDAAPVLFAALAAYWVENRIDGRNVTDLAKVLDGLLKDAAREAQAAPPGSDPPADVAARVREAVATGKVATLRPPRRRGEPAPRR